MGIFNTRLGIILYINDKQIKKFGPVFKHFDKENPRIEFYF